MTKILILAEHDHATLKPATLNVLTAAQKIGGDIDILVAGQNCDGAAKAAAALPGVKSVLQADAAPYAHFLAENVGALVAKLGANYTHILAPATTTGKNVLPRAARTVSVFRHHTATRSHE